MIVSEMRALRDELIEESKFYTDDAWPAEILTSTGKGKEDHDYRRRT